MPTPTEAMKEISTKVDWRSTDPSTLLTHLIHATPLHKRILFCTEFPRTAVLVLKIHEGRNFHSTVLHYLPKASLWDRLRKYKGWMLSTRLEQIIAQLYETKDPIYVRVEFMDETPHWFHALTIPKRRLHL